MFLPIFQDFKVIKFLIMSIYIFVVVMTAIKLFHGKRFKLNHKSLLEQPLFWASIALPLSISIFLGLFVWIDKIHSFEITSHGYYRFLEISKLPLLVLAASVPLASIVNNLHRTIQTEKQIMESERKNKTDTYYSHIKFQTDYFKSLPERVLTENIQNPSTKENITHSKTIKITYPLSLYQKLYPKSNPIYGVEYEVNREQTKKILQTWNNINKYLAEIEKNEMHINHARLNDIGLLLKLWYFVEKEIILLCNCLDITYPTYQKLFRFEHGDSWLITSIASFDEMYKILEALEDISIGIVDVTGQLTMVETQVFTKTSKLFSVGRIPAMLDAVLIGNRRSQPVEKTFPYLRLNGVKFEQKL